MESSSEDALVKSKLEVAPEGISSYSTSIFGSSNSNILVNDSTSFCTLPPFVSISFASEDNLDIYSPFVGPNIFFCSLIFLLISLFPSNVPR